MRVVTQVVSISQVDTTVGYNTHAANAYKTLDIRCMKARREADVLAKELESCRRQLKLVSSAGARSAAEKVRKHVFEGQHRAHETFFGSSFFLLQEVALQMDPRCC